MATHQISLLGGNINPDTTGNLYFEPYSVKTTNQLTKNIVAVFDDTSTKIGFQGEFIVPQNYVGNAAIIPIWSTSATSNAVIWCFEYRNVGGDDTTSLDQSTWQELVSASDNAPTAANRRLTPIISPTSGNFTAGSTVQYFFTRRGDDTGRDTMTCFATLIDLMFQYTDV